MKNQAGKNKKNVQPTLTAEEQAHILFMAEEEKLAQDVYAALADVWGLSIFDNIATSESRHVTMVEKLADQYGINTPNEASGVFVNPELQSLYDNLVAIGSQSLTNALKVGIAIEVVDIEDLQMELDSSSNNDLISTYSKLLNASESHLNSFTKTLDNLGDTLSVDDVSNWLNQEMTELNLVGQTETTNIDWM